MVILCIFACRLHAHFCAASMLAVVHQICSLSLLAWGLTLIPGSQVLCNRNFGVAPIDQQGLAVVASQSTIFSSFPSYSTSTGKRNCQMNFKGIGEFPGCQNITSSSNSIAGCYPLTSHVHWVSNIDPGTVPDFRHSASACPSPVRAAVWCLLLTVGWNGGRGHNECGWSRRRARCSHDFCSSSIGWIYLVPPQIVFFWPYNQLNNLLSTPWKTGWFSLLWK